MQRLKHQWGLLRGLQEYRRANPVSGVGEFIYDGWSDVLLFAIANMFSAPCSSVFPCFSSSFPSCACACPHSSPSPLSPPPYSHPYNSFLLLPTISFLQFFSYPFLFSFSSASIFFLFLFYFLFLLFTASKPCSTSTTTTAPLSSSLI